MVDSDAANRSIAKTGQNADGIGKKFSNGVKVAAGWGAAIAGGAVIAGGAIAAIAVPLVEAAANAQAMKAQFEQVFGDMQKDAQKTIDEMGKNFGMLPNRIKPAMSMMTSMFKGLGMDTTEAMATAERAVTLTADAAAFYDKSFEDANAALNSFIKGNYEGGEAIGLFANETQLAAYASKELGVDWKTLDEAGKQVARLEYAEAMQKSAGATGQASRESNSYTNQLGNLKQAWEDVKAKFGEPVLEPAVKMLGDLAAKVAEFDPQPIIDGITSLDDKFKEAAQSVEEFTNKWAPLILGLTGGVTAFYAITGAVALYNAALLFTMGTGPIYIAMTAGMAAITGVFGATLALVTSPIFLAALAIAALIAIGVLLYQNWDKIVAKAKELWSALKIIFEQIKQIVIHKVAELAAKAINKFNELKSSAILKFAELLTAARSKFNSIKSAIMDPINAAKDKVKGAIDKIKGFFSGMKLNLPKIKVPSFKLKNWSKNPLDWIGNMPSIGINWNAKGALFTKPTVFNTPMGLQGFGEAGPEAALPLNSSVLGMIGDKIAQTMDMNSVSQTDNRPIILQTFLDGKMIAEVIEPSMSKLLAKKMNNAGRGEFA